MLKNFCLARFDSCSPLQIVVIILQTSVRADQRRGERKKKREIKEVRTGKLCLGVLSFISVFAILKVITGECFICGAKRPPPPRRPRSRDILSFVATSRQCRVITPGDVLIHDGSLGFGFRLRCAHM